MVKPIIVTGCGRSGTHWLGGVLSSVLGPERAAFEPARPDLISDVIVDSRLRHKVAEVYKPEGHTVLHLVRDPHDVVRSLYSWYARDPARGSDRLFTACCEEWRKATQLMAGYRHLRLEDLIERGDPTANHILPPPEEWTAAQRQTFSDRCGAARERYGYAERWTLG